jgi:hypothetical protein
MAVALQPIRVGATLSEPGKNHVTDRDARSLAQEIVARVGKDIRLALPLGLGKPVTLVNALTQLAAEDRSISLSIFTALTLEHPLPDSDMARRFLDGAMDRLFGAYPALDYATWQHKGQMPDNIEVREFFLLAGRWLGNAAAQQSYIPANYTQALDRLVEQRPNLVLQLVARRNDQFSLSCNTDISADLLRLRRAGDMDFLLGVEVHDALPFFGGAAAFQKEEAELVLDNKEQFELFSAPRRPVSDTEHAIGLHVTRLIEDGGTLQIGIGAIGDAVANALLLRHRGEDEPVQRACTVPQGNFSASGIFQRGLYCVTEMLVEGVLQLYEAGVIRREVDGAAIHAAFFVESRDFYRRLCEMAEEDRARIHMMPVSFTNQLYGDEADKRAARVHARFINSAMKATVLGAITSDAIADGQVVSGVGGQMNFIDQAFALGTDARSIITLPATRQGRNGLESNIVWHYPHCTIPWQLRDIVVTEYGIADLRGRSDAEAAASMICIADSRFQDELTDKAKSANKLPQDWNVPESHRHNMPETIAGWIGPFRRTHLPEFPFGTDFTPVEQRLLPALDRLKLASNSRRELFSLAWAGLYGDSAPDEHDCVERMNLANPEGLHERMLAWTLRGALRAAQSRQRL